MSDSPWLIFLLLYNFAHRCSLTRRIYMGSFSIMCTFQNRQVITHLWNIDMIYQELIITVRLCCLFWDKYWKQILNISSELKVTMIYEWKFYNFVVPFHVKITFIGSFMKKKKFLNISFDINKIFRTIWRPNIAIISAINFFLWNLLVLLQYDISVNQNVHSDPCISGFCRNK